MAATGTEASGDAIVLRALHPDDRADVAALAARAFPAMQASFAVPSREGGVVALVEGRIAAVSLERIIVLPGGTKAGMIAWLMTDPERRGLGLASRLVRESLRRLREAGCTAVVTDVEGFNTASANVFHGAGFRRWTPRTQPKRWSPFDVAWLWLRTGVVLDPGHFLWIAHADGEVHDRAPAAPMRARAVAILLNAAFALLALSLGGGMLLPGDAGVPSPTTALAFLVGVAVLLLVRESAMRVAFGRGGGALEFRAWEGGWGITAAIALLLGRAMPMPGNVYPAGDGWRTRDHVGRLGRGAVASALALAALVLAASAARGTGISPGVDAVAAAIVFVGKPLLVFDTAIAVAPFDGFNARRLRNFHTPTWLALASLGIAVFVWG
ncbi:GNAT family N-acetyltransferase [Salinarimonas chemoclinalis]|uniref:GNAT family N-acetyltransferase n=1 Tax=Salinarimonas chemoclinalis TaxID=3241599 RepID=UPI00355678DF